MPYSVSELFATHGIPSFYELLRKCIYNFSERIRSSKNSIIKACLSPLIFIFSPIDVSGDHYYFNSSQYYLILMNCIIYY